MNHENGEISMHTYVIFAKEIIRVWLMRLKDGIVFPWRWTMMTKLCMDGSFKSFMAQRPSLILELHYSKSCHV